MIRVLVADDQALVRDGLRLILEVEPELELVGDAGNGREAVEMTRRLRPDVVLMDVRMPEMDGLEATRRIVAGGSPARVLMLTTYDEDSYLYESVRAGASGFLLKDSRRAQLREAIRTVMSGEAILHPRLTRRLLEGFASGPRPDESTTRFAGLSVRELEVLRLVARGANNSEIAAALHLSEATVKTHLAHVMHKLQLRDRVQAVVTAYEGGLVRPGDAGA